MTQAHTVSRRTFLRSAAQLTTLGALAGAGLVQPGLLRPVHAQSTEPPLVWVWKSAADGDLAEIRDHLASHNLGIILKTHDGTHWMEEYDDTQYAITGAEQVSRLAAMYEQAGVPFHAWCVVQGNDPIREAEMCAEVLDAGARSIFLDLEPDDGSNYWQGRPHDAFVMGEELRRLKPNAHVVLAPDVRPWQAPLVPLAEFMSFSDAVAPQSYWATFQGPTNGRLLREHGFSADSDGFTPELAVEVAEGTFQQFGRPIQPIGSGAASADEWRRFVVAAESRGMQPLSLWRYGSADPGAFTVLREMIDRQRQAAQAAQAAATEAPSESAPEPVVASPEPPIEVRSSWLDDSIYETSSMEDTAVTRSEELFDLTRRIEMVKQRVQEEIRRLLRLW